MTCGTFGQYPLGTLNGPQELEVVYAIINSASLFIARMRWKRLSMTAQTIFEQVKGNWFSPSSFTKIEGLMKHLLSYFKPYIKESFLAPLFKLL